MVKKVSRILRRAIHKEGTPLNILTFCAHEPYEIGLSQTGHAFYSYQTSGARTWEDRCRKRPCNYTLLDGDKKEHQIPPDVEIDLIISHNKLVHFPIARSLSASLGVPFIHMEHTLPTPNMSSGYLKVLRQSGADVNAFISDYNRDQWGWDEESAIVIKHGIDTGLFRPDLTITRRPIILAAVNDWIKRDYFCGFHFWREVADGLPCFVVGNTPGLSEPTKTVEELIWRYQTSRIFINTSQVSPVPMSVLEASSCGCSIVTTATCMLPEIFQNGVNAFITNDKQQMRGYLERLLADEELATKMGMAARQTILEEFPLSKHIDRWNEVIKRTVELEPCTKI